MIAAYSDSIFINCPFDKVYEPLLQCIVFTIYRCGFVPRSALEEDDSSDIRIEKIVRLINKCKFGIHDISRTELDDTHRLPRFNMPFELGIFWGAKKFGNKVNKEKIALILDKEKFRYQKYFSDLNGVDIKAHDNQPDSMIQAVRNWIHTTSGRTTIPFFETIRSDYNDFVDLRLPVMLTVSYAKLEELTFNDYCAYVSAALKERLAQSK